MQIHERISREVNSDAFFEQFKPGTHMSLFIPPREKDIRWTTSVAMQIGKVEQVNPMFAKLFPATSYGKEEEGADIYGQLAFSKPHKIGSIQVPNLIVNIRDGFLTHIYNDGLTAERDEALRQLMRLGDSRIEHVGLQLSVHDGIHKAVVSFCLSEPTIVLSYDLQDTECDGIVWINNQAVYADGKFGDFTCSL